MSSARCAWPMRVLQAVLAQRHFAAPDVQHDDAAARNLACLVLREQGREEALRLVELAAQQRQPALHGVGGQDGRAARRHRALHQAARLGERLGGALEVAELAIRRGRAEQREQPGVEPVASHRLGHRLPIDRQRLLGPAHQLQRAGEVAAQVGRQRAVGIALAQRPRRLLVERQRPLDVAGGDAGDGPVVLDADGQRRPVAAHRRQPGQGLGVEAIGAVVSPLELLGIGEIAEQRGLQPRMRTLGRLQRVEPGLGAALRGGAVALVLGDERHLLVAGGGGERRQGPVAKRGFDLARAGLGIAEHRVREAVQAARLGADAAHVAVAQQLQDAAQLGLGLRRIADGDLVRGLRHQDGGLLAGVAGVLVLSSDSLRASIELIVCGLSGGPASVSMNSKKSITALLRSSRARARSRCRRASSACHSAPASPAQIAAMARAPAPR